MRQAIRNAGILLSVTLKACLILAALAGPLMAVKAVNAGSEQTIGELPRMSSGAGLVLLVSLQRY